MEKTPNAHKVTQPSAQVKAVTNAKEVSHIGKGGKTQYVSSWIQPQKPVAAVHIAQKIVK